MLQLFLERKELIEKAEEKERLQREKEEEKRKAEKEESKVEEKTDSLEGESMKSSNDDKIGLLEDSPKVNDKSCLCLDLTPGFEPISKI